MRWVPWVQFAVCAAVIWFAGARLCRYGDVIAEKAGLSRTWIGLILLATVTSLPELVAGVSAVAVVGAPDIAVGDAMGSCVFNLLIITGLDFLRREASVFTVASQGHVLSAGFGVILIGMVAFTVLIGDRAALAAIGHVSPATPLILLFYAVAMRTVFRYERRQIMLTAETAAERYPGVTYRAAVAGYGLAAGVVVIAGAFLPFVGRRLAVAMGWEETFVGTLFVAAVTSLPELVVTIAAVRIGALDMAIGNLLGSNLFDIVIVAVDDLCYLPGALLAEVSPMHAVTACSATMMTGVAIVGLLYRPQTRLFRAVGWASLTLLLLYLLNTSVLYLAHP